MMKRLALATGILALAVPLAMAQTSTWINDPAHSDVSFSILHMGISYVRGHFGKVTATIVMDKAEISKSRVTATIDVTGIDTGVTMRDNDLKSSGFFDVAKYPTAKFVSTSVSKSSDGLTVDGNLTLRGITKPVVLNVKGPTGPVQGMMDHKLHEGYYATTTLNRTAFDIGSKAPSMMVGDKVNVTIDLDVAKQ